MDIRVADVWYTIQLGVDPALLDRKIREIENRLGERMESRYDCRGNRQIYLRDNADAVRLKFEGVDLRLPNPN